tara:strand:- start:8676 stop:13250 length:4575 start_codon:yes stop_codon:yes gene_type:complete
MPETKHTFASGKMNKDLDERLVPNGEYRHAVNVRVNTSDASDVGALNNILGNDLVFPSVRNGNAFNLHANAQCVGAISDEKNNCFYWFVQNFDLSDLILKYDTQSKTVIPVLVDTFINTPSAVLNFQRDNIITGINIINNLLFWTDNYGEPKKINIDNCILGTNNFSPYTTHTKLHNPILDTLLGVNAPYTDSSVNLKEEHITVIKRAPLRAPEMDLISSGLFNMPGVVQEFRFSDGAGTLWSPGNYTGASSQLVVNGTNTFGLRINSSSDGLPYSIVPGETIIQLKSVQANQIGYDTDSDGFVDQLNDSFNQEYSYASDYDIRCKILKHDGYGTTSSPGPSYTGSPLQGYAWVFVEILSIKPNTTLNKSDWVVNFEQGVDNLFEDKFPRFAYRYKYIDGEYSPYSPFTRVAFNASTFSQDTIRGYNLGMRNDLKEVKLYSFVNKDASILGQVISKKIPHDVVGIDILYKESNSPIVYVVESISPKNTNVWSAVPSSPVAAAIGNGVYSITSDTIYNVVAENQLLRSFDSVPKKALAQEVTGNRIVYGNYEQNIDLSQDPISLNLFYSNSSFVIQDEIGVPSIKSIRNYQLGIVYEDKYGRQTPVLTNNEATLKIPITQSSSPIKLEAEVLSPHPSEAQSYKFYIKETSSEYYNLPLAKWYNAEDNNIWLSFISADRNKIDENDYLYLKKAHGSDFAVLTPNKYKVLAISNEAPDFIKTNRKPLGSLAQNNSDAEPLFNDYTFMPIKGKTEFRINSFLVDSSGFSEIEQAQNLEMVLSDPNTNNFSDRYKITSAKKDPLNDVGYIIVLDRPFGTDINFVEDSSSTASLPVIKDGVTLEITSGNVENKPEFDGKFFVKINKDFNIVNNIFSYSGNVEDLSITHQEPLLYYTDTNVNQFTQPGGNGWNVSGTQIRRSSNSSFTLNGNAIPRAEQSFGDGTSFSTLDSNGPRWFIDKLPYEGLKQGPSQGGSSGTNNGINGYYIDISFSGIPIAPGGDYLTRNDDGWVVGSTANTYTDQEVTMTENLNVGKQFYFADDPDQTLYTIQNVEIIDIYNYIDFVNIYSTVAMNSASNYRKTWRLRLDKQIVNQTFDPTANSINQVSNSNPVSINFVESRVERDGSVRLTKNPAVFETKPKRDEGLEIYHEASESFDISRIGQQELNFYNCYVFGNGVESNRVRDDFNAAKIDNGPKVSAVYEGEYKRERIKNGLIYSGLYNFKSGLNNLNQFIIAEKITKDLNPTYGSIQKLFSRQTDLIAFCEDRVVRILANKDAVFNADGNPNLIATNNVLGQTMPFSGNYGISTDPASFASDNYRAYFSDKQRGAVLRLSMDGLTPISEYGMSDYFRDTLKVSSKTTGSYDKNNKEYNLSILPMDVKDPEVTVSFDEKSKGWVSFKSFIPEVALSSSSVYYSFKNGKLYEHDVETVNRNTFYNAYEDSEVTVLLNEIPSTVKNYKTISYEGTDSAIQQEISTNITTGLPNTGYYNLTTKQGWRVEYISTDQDDGKIKEFIKKEGKWFNYIKGINNII